MPLSIHFPSPSLTFFRAPSFSSLSPNLFLLSCCCSSFYGRPFPPQFRCLSVRPSVRPPLESKPKRQRRISATPLGPRFFHPHLFTLSFLLLSPMFILIFVVKMLNIKMFMFSSIQFQVRIRTQSLHTQYITCGSCLPLR